MVFDFFSARCNKCVLCVAMCVGCDGEIRKKVSKFMFLIENN